MASTLIGLDIGSTGVRAAELSTRRHGLALKRYAEVPLRPGIVRAGAVVDVEGLAGALRELWDLGRFGGRTVVLGVANAGVLVRQMDLDWMPPADFRQALRYQVQDALPFPVEDANLDYHLLGEPEVPDEQGQPQRRARVLLVAATRDGVDAFVTAAAGARLRVAAVDLLPFALVRAAHPGPPDAAGAVEAVVDVGADVTTVVVHAGGTPRFVRIVAGLGGETITQALQQRYDWGWEEAEQTKIALGLVDEPGADPAQPAHPARWAVAAAADQLLGEVATTLDFYRGLPGGPGGESAESDPVGRLLLRGGGTRLRGLAEALAQRTGLPVGHLDAAAALHLGRRESLEPAHLAALAVPAGLCTAVA